MILILYFKNSDFCILRLFFVFFSDRSQFLIGNLAVCNICLALGLFVYTFLIDVYYHVDSFDTLLLINGGKASSKLPRFSKEIWIVSKVCLNLNIFRKNTRICFTNFPEETLLSSKHCFKHFPENTYKSEFYFNNFPEKHRNQNLF